MCVLCILICACYCRQAQIKIHKKLRQEEVDKNEYIFFSFLFPSLNKVKRLLFIENVQNQEWSMMIEFRRHTNKDL